MDKKRYGIPSLETTWQPLDGANQADSPIDTTQKVLKMEFVFGWAMKKNIADWICNVSYHGSANNKLQFKDL